MLAEPAECDEFYLDALAQVRLRSCVAGRVALVDYSILPTR